MDCPIQLQIPAVAQTLKAKTERLLAPLAQEEGLTSLQMCVLLHLYRADAPVGSVSQCTGMGQANASALCKKLEEAGFLTRVRSEGDRRVVNLSLTEQGREAVTRFRQGLDRYMTLLNAVPQDQKDALVRGVQAAEQILDYLYEQGKGE